MEDYVYFIEDMEMGNIKIGRSRNPAARFAKLQTGSPGKLKILGILHDTKGDLEAKIHRILRPYWLRGEWFKGTPEVKAYADTGYDLLAGETRGNGAEKGRQRVHWRPRVLSAEEAERLLAGVNPKCATGLRNLVALLLMLRMGLQVSEVPSLRLDDVDLKQCWLHVHGNGSKDRVLHLDRQVMAILALWLDRRPKRSRVLLPIIQTGRRGDGHAKTGKPMAVRYLQELVARLGRKAGVGKRVYCQMLRHSYTCAAVRLGIPILQLQKDLGHSDLQTTATYLHVIDGEWERSANEIPLTKLPGGLGAPAEPEPTPTPTLAAKPAAILTGLGWRRQDDGSWLPP